MKQTKKEKERKKKEKQDEQDVKMIQPPYVAEIPSKTISRMATLNDKHDHYWGEHAKQTAFSQRSTTIERTGKPSHSRTFFTGWSLNKGNWSVLPLF